jgi:hypothetical protein
MMGPVVQANKEMGYEVMHILGGCTCVLEPVDVYCNHLRNWMVQEAIMHGKIKCSSRE